MPVLVGFEDGLILRGNRVDSFIWFFVLGLSVIRRDESFLVPRVLDIDWK